MRIALGFLALVCIAAGIAGCSSAPDPALAPWHTQLPKAGMARVVVLYPAPLVSSNGMAQIRWNGDSSCDLKSGDYLVHDVRAGDEVIEFSFCGLRGASSFAMNAEAGRIYYLRIKPYDSSFLGMLSGYPGEFPPEGAPAHKGPFEIERLEEAQAMRELRRLTAGTGIYK